ncbi:uncharacterized protein FPRN_06624 [Fusarium proliferatum]|nr:uncharacterized protein FPRN_06624 [Fusarium proliferatum]
MDSLEISEQNAEHNPHKIASRQAPPYTYTTPSEDQVLIPGKFFLNPELDTLEIDGWPLLANFASDPSYGVTSFSPSGLVPFLITLVQKKRCVKSWLGFEASHLYTTLMWTKYPTNVPLDTNVFCIIADPRLIGREVFKNIYFKTPHSSDLGRQYRKWMELLDELGVTAPCVYKIAYTTIQIKPSIAYESDVVAHLKYESKRRKTCAQTWEESWQEPVWMHLEEATGQLQGAVETAIGFWTFPIESLGQFRPAQDRTERPVEHFYDLSAVQPELCLFELYPSRLRTYIGH